MKQRILGQGLTVSAIGMGCMTLTEQNYGPVDEVESERTLLAAIDAGVTLLDSGETYGRDHSNEKLLGRVLKARRDEVVLCTKFGLTYDITSGSMVVDGDPRKIRISCEGSLQRLQTDHIDIYYQHRVDTRYPVEDVWGVLKELVDEGKIRHLGLSEPGIETLRAAHAIHPVTAVQNEYSLFTRDPEAELRPVLDELGIGLVCFAPLGRGLLSGRVRSPDDWAPDDFRRRLPRYQGENFVKNLELVDKVHEIARAKGATPAQLALAWILSRGDGIVPIPGMETRTLLAENTAAANIEISADELAQIEAVIPGGAVGSRYGSYAELTKAETVTSA
ncbi:MAG: aldo/keto reductase [Pseudonocardia sp. SCN 72-86]|nr:MAG: aldo/keto reductase [Pseudonocardia sp. SCN 72-86]